MDEVTSQIRGIIDGTITDFDAFDKHLALKDRAKQIRKEEAEERRLRYFLNGVEGKGEGKKYKWWCKRCFVEYYIDLPEGKCTRCGQSDKMMSQQERWAELMGKLEDFKETKAKHKWRKDKWNRWKKSQTLLGRSRNINYKAWEFWEPDTDSEEEGDPIVPKDNPEFRAMEADLKDRKKKQAEKAKTAERCRQRGNQSMSEGDFVGAIEHYDEGLEYRRDLKALWTNKALAELKVFRWHDAISSCNKVIEYAEIFEEGFQKSADACFKAFTRRAQALRALHKWEDALNDLEDAVALVPSSKEALDLLEKTRAAAEEAKTAQKLEEDPGVAAPEAVAAEPSGPVRVEIEESDEEQGEEESLSLVPAGSQPSFLQGLTDPQFKQLEKDLKTKDSERILFCARKGEATKAYKPSPDQWVGRKIDLKVDDVVEPSKLDIVLKDIDRCCVLWRKRRKVGGSQALQDDEPESVEADAFVATVTPRALGVLSSLAAASDHHCALTAAAVRSVWPLLEVEEWRYQVLFLLFEWSQRSISGKTMAEFAGRYPDPHVQLLIDMVTKEQKENILPPGFEDLARKAADRIELGADVEEAAAGILDGLSVLSPLELSLGTLGNLCLSGCSLKPFKEQIVPLLPRLVEAVSTHLKPLDWRVCGRAAGALCNILRLGEPAAVEVEKSTQLLVTALEAEAKPERLAATKALGLGATGGALQGFTATATARLLGCLVNLVALRPTALAELQTLGALRIIASLVDPNGFGAGSSTDDENDPEVVSARACLLCGRLVGAFPEHLASDLEAELLRRLTQLLERVDMAEVARSVQSSESNTPSVAILDWLDPALRLLASILMKVPGSLQRADKEGAQAMLPTMLARLCELARALRPPTHLAPSQEGAVSFRLRGNLALLFGNFSELQMRGEAPGPLEALDLESLVEVFVDTLRKERGAPQHNLGVCVTKLAQNPNYREKVRDLKGLESLHQIQLPKVTAQKEKDMRQHRLQTSSEDRRREVNLRLQQKALSQ